MKYPFNVQDPYKIFLLSGQKTVEGRLNKGKFGKIKPGYILFFDSGEEFEILEKNIYKNFAEMLEKEGLKNVLPDKTDIKNGVETVYYKFYSKELEKKFGVSAIKVRRVK